MPIVLDPDVPGRLLPEATLHLQARSRQDPDRLTRALAAVAADIARLADDQGGPALVSAPIPTPEGPMLLLDLADTSEDRLRTIPALVVRRLAEAGVTDAQVCVPPHTAGRGAALQHWTPAVRCWMRATGPHAAPRLLGVAQDWLRQETPQDADWLQVTSGTEFPIAPQDAPHAAAALLGAGVEAALLAGRFTTLVHAISVLGPPFPGPARASLGTAGVHAAAADAVAAMHRARELLRAQGAGLCWGGVGAEPDARDLTSALWQDRTRSRRVDPVTEPDQFVPDGLWYQLLTPGHLSRLGGLPAGSVELAPGLVELTVGTAEQWLPDHSDLPTVRALARQLLARCLASS